MRKIHSDLGNPYYIFAPDYTDTSSGISVLHYLCHALNISGKDAYMVNCKIVNKNLKTPILKNEDIERHVSGQLVPIIVYPEVVSGNPLNGKVVVRYFLHREGFHNSNKIDGDEDDVYVYFNEWCAGGSKKIDAILTFPILDRQIFNPGYGAVERKFSYVYQNRFPVERIDFDVLPKGTQLLAAADAKNLEELAALFREAKVLYSYEWSFTCVAARLCGCPVVFMRESGVDDSFLSVNVGGAGGAGLYSDNLVLADLVKTVPDCINKYKEVELNFWDQLDFFIDLTQRKSKSTKDLKLLGGEFSQPFVQNIKESDSGWGVSEWLICRAPSSARVLALQTILKANPDVGSLGIAIIVAEESSEQDLVETIESLKAQHRSIDSLWLIGGSIPESIKGEGIELLNLEDQHWTQKLSARIEQGAAPDFLWILYAGDKLLPHATLTMGEYRLRNPEALVWYADEAIVENGVPAKPMLKPDFNIDLLRSYPYVGRNLVLSTAVIQAVGGLDNQVNDFACIDLIWRLVEAVGPSAVAHVPEVLLFSEKGLMDWVEDPLSLVWFPVVTQMHFVRLGREVTVTPIALSGLQRIDYALPVRPFVSIIIPTCDQLPVLQHCIEGLLGITEYSHYELLIVDTGSSEQATVQYLSALSKMESEQIRVLYWSRPFNFAAINNFAVEQARGDVLLFLNNDIQFGSKVAPNWLEYLLQHVLRPEVGAVGTRLNLPDGRVDQCGLVLGMRGSVGPAFYGMPVEHQGYMRRLVVQQNVSALSASCMMMRRDVFHELEGFDAESFSSYYADVDLCLKATQKGYLLVLEPDTGLEHMGGATRLLMREDKRSLLFREKETNKGNLYDRWLSQLARDPNYHPAYTYQPPGFSLSPEGARIQEPLPGRPFPVVLAAHYDWFGCGYYRILHPFKALEGEMRLDGGVGFQGFRFNDVAHIQPDVLLLQNRNFKSLVSEIQHYRQISNAKIVVDFDDYLPNIPTRSIHRRQISQGVIKDIRKILELVDWVVVSTPNLAEEYSRFHNDIRIAFNGLPLNWWGEVKGQRRVGKKMRVGWAGGSSHAGDLAEIKYVVKELGDEVEWVFMGMKPDGIDCEFHPGVKITQYPEKLASLNLDLAVIPLEMNQFNRSKSNLRLLELGVCGVPIICTDIEPYRCGLPVTLVRNKHQDWVDAIRSHIAEPEALARVGDDLRRVILDNWMLEGEFLSQWERAWVGDQ